MAAARFWWTALTALRNDDIELARSVVARDSQIDASEHEIEHRCLQLLLRQQPVASDLRKVSTALKMVTDVERIGDQASDIAELVLHLHAKSTDAVGVLEDILKMGDDVLKMVKRSIAAYVQVDLAAAAEVIAHDDVIDTAFRRISSAQDDSAKKQRQTRYIPHAMTLVTRPLST